MKTLKDPNISIEEACRTIAFYMGYRDAFNPCDNKFGKNYYIDKYQKIEHLQSVWEKFGRIGFDFRFDDNLCFCYYLIDSVGDEYSRVFTKIDERELSIMDKMIISTALALIEKDTESTIMIDLSKL